MSIKSQKEKDEMNRFFAKYEEFVKRIQNDPKALNELMVATKKVRQVVKVL